MSLTDVDRLKDVLKLNSIKDEWITDSKIIVSPLGDFLIVASSSAAVFYIKKYTNSIPEFQFCRIHRPTTYEPSPGTERSCGSISAIYYLPVKIEQQGRSHDLWHCAVIGYTSGVVEFVSDSGQILAQKHLQDKPVLKFRTLLNSASQQGLQSHPASSCLVPKLSELLVVFDGSIVSISGSSLIATLIKNRRELSGAKSSMEDLSQVTNRLSKFSTKKWIVKEQTVSDVAGISVPNFHLFDQLNLISMNRDLFNEDQMKSLGTLVKYISVGQNPFIQTNTPHRFGPQKVHELAENVVSTVKSGIFRVATGLIWGSSPSSTGSTSGGSVDASTDTEQKLEIFHSFKDRSKTAVCIESSHNGRYSAILDAHHRIIIQDNLLGAVIHILKGYHHAQMGWITTSWEGRKEAPDKLPNVDQEFAVLLVLYLPRRGILEIWSPEQMIRIVEFPVGKSGRLILPSDAMLDASPRSGPCVRIFECSFMGPTGIIQKIYIPVHALTRRSTSHDRTLLKQLKTILLQESPIQENLSKVTELILASKDVNGKIRMLLDLFHCDGVSSLDCRTVLEAVTCQLVECAVAKRHCDRLLRALDLFDYLTTTANKILEPQTEEMWTEGDLKLLEVFDSHKTMSVNEDSSRFDPTLTLAEFSSCFQLRQLADKDSSDKISGDISIDALRFADQKFSTCRNRFKLLYHIGQCGSVDFDSTKDLLNRSQLEGNILETILTTFLTSNFDELKKLGQNRQEFLYRLIFELYSESGGAPELIHRARKIILRSQLTPTTGLVVLVWKYYLGNQHSSTFASEWVPFLNNLESYLNLVTTKINFLPQDGNGSDQEISYHRYDDVFMSGNGRISELVASWIIENRNSNKMEASETQVGLFLEKCRHLFPLSCSVEVISAHLAWQNFQVWSKNHSELVHLQSAYDCLVKLESLSIRQRLTALAWVTFLNKAAKDSISVTEIRSATRCERELGLPEESLPKFLRLTTKILRILLLDNQDSEWNADSKHAGYDTLYGTPSGMEHLMDKVSRMSLPDVDTISVQYQFLFVADALWNFGLDDIKPLTMFNSQEANVFFQNTASLSMSSAFRLFSGEHGRGVRNVRRKFLELSCDGAVACIHHSADADDGFDFGLYYEWCNHLLLLSKMWRMTEKFHECQILSLYRAGHDSLGEEMFNTLDEEQRKPTGIKLLRLCLLRLAAFLHFDDDRLRRVAAVQPGLISKLTTLRPEACGPKGVTEVPLKFSSDLLVNITNLGIDETSLQVAYECLTVVQMFRKD